MARAQSSGTGTWMDHLPFVLLGIRTAVREDSSCSPSDLLYGEHLRLPASLLDTASVAASADSFVADLRGIMQQNSPMPFLYHGDQPSRVPSALKSCSHVFLRVDAVRRPLSPPYEGPFLVLHRSPKTFRLLRLGKEVTVTVDRLKPATVLSSSSSTGQESPSGPPTVAPSSASSSMSPPPPARVGVASHLDPQDWPLPTRSGRQPRPVRRLGVD